MVDDIDKQKNIEHYSASVAAWYDTQLEHDKSLLTLSAGGIGLLVTLLTTVGVSSAESLVLNVCAILAFLFCLGSVLVIFRRNAEHVEQVVKNEAPPHDPVLGRLDAIATWSFAIGVVFSVVIGISAAISSYSNKEKKMGDPEKTHGGSRPLHESFNGAANLRPETDLAKSFNGAAKLQPPTQQTPSPTANVPSPTTSQSAQSDKK